MHSMYRYVYRVALLSLIIMLIGIYPPSTLSAQAAPPQIWLPTPIDEEWTVIQGFNCGTHAGEREVDLARVTGSSVGAPVRAAADGTIHFWTASSGTLIVHHGNNYYTEYTHMSDTFSAVPGTPVYQGQVVGHLDGYSHLHFSFYYSAAGSYFSRQTLELDFLDGYSLHDTYGCNQNYGEIVIARDNADVSPPEVVFASDMEPGTWYCEDHRIDFTIADDRRVQGFDQQFNNEPATDAPAFVADAGYVQLAWAGEGEHILQVRAWDSNGNTTLATFGPVGYDIQAPTYDQPTELPEKTYRRTHKSKPFALTLAWSGFADGMGAGIAGYQYYMGTDEQGTSDNFTESSEITLDDVQPGCYVLRVQAHDHACSKSEWVTVQRVIVTDNKGKLPPDAMCAASDDGDGEDDAQEKPTLVITNKPTPTSTDEPTGTPTPTSTDEPTGTPTPTPTDEPTGTPTPTPTDEPTGTSTPTVTDEPTPTVTDVPTPTVTDVPTPTVTDEPTPTVTDEPTPTVTDVPTPTVTDVPTPTVTDEPTPTVTDEPTPTVTDMPTPTVTDVPTPTVTDEPTPTAIPTDKLSPTSESDELEKVDDKQAPQPTPQRFRVAP